MTKLYYTDALKAAWMSSEFGVRYIKSPELPEWGRYHSNYSIETTISIQLECGKQSDSSVLYKTKAFPDYPFSGRYFIHPDSLSIFEPMEGDIVQIDNFFGSIDSGCRKISGIRQVDANGGTGPFYDYYDNTRESDWFMPDDPIRIIQRNGKAFFAPETEA